MKILLIISLAIVLSAFDTITAAKIFDKIFHGMISKEYIAVYSSNKIYREVILSATSLHLSDSCKDADIVLIDNLSEIPKECKDKILFSTSYLAFKKFDNAVGAFYWDRGHISIKFLKSRLDKHKIKLPNTFKKYMMKEKP